MQNCLPKNKPASLSQMKLCDGREARSRSCSRVDFTFCACFKRVKERAHEPSQTKSSAIAKTTTTTTSLQNVASEDVEKVAKLDFCITRTRHRQ